MKRITRRISVAAVALTASAGAGAVALPASPASAVVLISYPGTSVKVGHTFTVGDWFQQFSGGSRWFTTNVYSPSGARVLHETGYAPSTHWDLWNVRATRTGNYKVMYEYRLRNGHNGFAWYTVRSHR
jgi:hypothetical protein